MSRHSTSQAFTIRLERSLIRSLDQLAREAGVSRQRLISAVLGDAVKFAAMAKEQDLFAGVGSIVEDAVRRAVVEAGALQPVQRVVVPLRKGASG